MTDCVDKLIESIIYIKYLIFNSIQINKTHIIIDFISH